MRRREFITLIAGTASAWPLAARAQQQTAIPVIGFLDFGTAAAYAPIVVAFRRGLNESGYVDGQSVAIEYRWAEDRYDRLPALADDLARRHVAVIMAGSTPGALAAKAATATIPIVFTIGSDPVKLGLVDSLNRPGGNLTGFTQLGNVLAPKQLDLLHELVPTASVIGMLVNSDNPNAAVDAKGVEVAARTLGLELIVLNVTSEHDLDASFATLVQHRVGALLASITLSLGPVSEKIIALAERFAIPAIYAWREDVAAGGLMSYGSDESDAFRLAGTYVGRILKGAKPADLPVQQATKVALVVNLKTAKALGVTIPLPLLGRADEVIE